MVGRDSTKIDCREIGACGSFRGRKEWRLSEGEEHEHGKRTEIGLNTVKAISYEFGRLGASTLRVLRHA